MSSWQAQQKTGAVDGLRRVLHPLRTYHRHEVVGASHVPTEGPALLAVNHSLATYDAFLLGMGIHEETGRLPVGLGDDLLFRIPKVREFVTDIGLRPASPGAGLQALEEGQLLGVAPGGMREALRPWSERYVVAWEHRKGFVKLAMQAKAPIVLAACAAADDLYTVYPSRLTKVAYKHFKVPFPLARGLGPSLLPRPAKLVHVVGVPIEPVGEPDDPQAVDALHTRCLEQMESLMETSRLLALASDEPVS